MSYDDMPIDSRNGHLEPNSDADSAPEPRLVSAQAGRFVSLAGLIERVAQQFREEHGGDSPALQAANSEMARIKLVRDTAAYIFSVESVQLSPEEQSEVIQKAYSELFGYGPLDALLSDDNITTIALEGVHKISARYGPGKELTPLEAIFEDAHQQRRMIRRMLANAGAELRDDQPIVETGFKHNGRAVSLSVTGPPVAFDLTVDIRLHLRQLPLLENLAESGFMTEQAAVLLRAIAQSPHGFAIVGDTESGKTTLLSILSHLLPAEQKIISVERSGELQTPDWVIKQVVRWPVGENAGVSFGDLIRLALEESPEVLLLDEVRADEPETIAPLLAGENAPRLIWNFRGASDSARIRSALGMLARRADMSQPEAMVHALYRRLPFLVVVKRRRGWLELQEIAEWQFSESAAYPDLVTLVEKGWDSLQLTTKHPSRSLDLPEDFWP